VEKPINIRIYRTSDLREYLQSEPYQQALQQTFATRARVGRVLGNFLLDNSIGQFLVRAQIFTHPIIGEKEKHEERVKVLADKITETLPQSRRSDMELLVRLEPDFQPRSVEQVILETCIDKLASFNRFTPHDYNANRDLGRSFAISLPQIFSALPSLPPEQKKEMERIYPSLLADQKMAMLRDRFYTLLSDRDWPGFLEFLDHHQTDPGCGSQLNSLVFQHRRYIFPNEHFRAALFKYLISLLIAHGEARFQRFDTFWQESGLDMSDRRELQELSKLHFPHDLWYELMHENTPRYFSLLELLHSYGIRP
jgi:hypothetical protein